MSAQGGAPPTEALLAYAAGMLYPRKPRRMLGLGGKAAPEVVGVCKLEQALPLRHHPRLVIPGALHTPEMGLQVVIGPRSLRRGMGQAGAVHSGPSKNLHRQCMHVVRACGANRGDTRPSTTYARWTCCAGTAGTGTELTGKDGTCSLCHHPLLNMLGLLVQLQSSDLEQYHTSREAPAPSTTACRGCVCVCGGGGLVASVVA